MTTVEMVKKIEAYNEWKNLLEEAKKELEVIEKEIKEEMIERNIEELEADQYIVRYKSILSSRFDSKSFKEKHEDLYKEYMKQIQSHRFTISA